MNLAVRRTPKPHVTIKYLESDFAELFLNALGGLARNGSPTPATGAGSWPVIPGSAGLRWPPACGSRSSATCWLTRSRLCHRSRPRRPSRSRCPPGWPRAASSARPGSATRRWPPFTSTLTWTGPRPRTARVAPAAAAGRAVDGHGPGPPWRADQRRSRAVGFADPRRAVPPGRPGGGSCLLAVAAAEAPSPRGRRSSSAPPTGSGPPSPGSRTSTHIAFAAASRSAPWNGWWAAITPRQPGW